MSDELNNYLLVIDSKKAMQDLEDLEEKRKTTEKNIKKTTKEADKQLGKTWMKAVSVMQGTWHSIETMTRAMGIAIPTMYRAVISSVFSAAKILIPLFTAMEMSPLTMIQGIMGLTQIGLSVSAAIAGEKEADEASSQLSDINSMIGGISSLIGVWSF